jgi:TonB-dependent receptor
VSLYVLFLAAFLLSPLSAQVTSGSSAQPPAGGSIAGTVSNDVTGKFLRGANVEIPRLGLTSITDDTGRFVFLNVPAGAHELVVSYIGLDAARSTVVVSPGQRSAHNFDLTTGIYQLDEFRVVGEREGSAAAITAQRIAPNLKNVVATDSFGNLPNMGAGEVLMRVPGVTATPTEEGILTTSIRIRGIDAALNTVTIDGAPVTPIGMNRAFDMSFLPAFAMFDQMEVIKGHTPDHGADSLGGTVNLKTRSAFDMKEKRRITYNLSLRAASPFTDQIPRVEEDPYHPSLSAGYQEVFSVLGRERNLGLSMNAFYSVYQLGYHRRDFDYQNTSAEPAFIWYYKTEDSYNLREQSNVNFKAEYRLSASTKVSANFTVNDNFQKARLFWYTTASTSSQNQNTVPSATTSIVPGYSSLITEVRPVPTSIIELFQVGEPGNVYMNRMRRVDLAAEQVFGRLQLDYAASYSRTGVNYGQGEGAATFSRITNAGWIIDRTESDTYPRFVQTAGPDLSSPASYRASPNGLFNIKGVQFRRLRDARANARYMLPTRVQTSIKAGFHWRDNLGQTVIDTRRWNYLLDAPLPNDPNPTKLYDEVKTGRSVPMFDARYVISGDRVLTNPEHWAEDLYFRTTNKYIATKSALETVTAGYAMVEGKLGREGWFSRTGYLTGVRVEKTDTEGSGYVLARASARSTPAQQLTDPIGSATRDYADNLRQTEGSYTNSFPSAHLFHDITSNLKARLSWSTSFGRPAMTNFTPGESGDELTQTLTVNNPAIKPQTSTNWDASIDYYFEPVGNLSVGFFRKKITDFIVGGYNTGRVPPGADNGYGGEYANFTRVTTFNAGTAYVQGWELSYQHQFTFLPGILKGLGISANFTFIDTHGDFGGTTNLNSGEVVGFVPRAANVMLSWRYHRFNSRVLYNQTSDHIIQYSAASAGFNSYREEADLVNISLEYQLRPWVSLTCDFNNVFNEPQILYRGYRHRLQSYIMNPSVITFGVTGRF